MHARGIRRLLTAVGLMGAMTISAQSAEKVLIATFGDPIPAQMAAHNGTIATATGWDVEWRKFNAGPDVIAAMASGDVKIAELGSSPLAIAATQDVDLQVFMIDYVIGEAESLIVRNGSGIEKLEDLRGKRVAVPIGSTSHYSLMGALKHAGIAEKELTILNMPPDQITAAWQQEAIDAAFVWPPAQTQLLATGKRLAGADKVAEWGYPTFNAWVVNREFAQSHKDEVVQFIKTVEEANEAYRANVAAWTPDSPQIKAIAAETGAEPSQVPETLKGYKFLPLAEQAKPEWLGGAMAGIVKSTAAFLKDAGRLDHVSDDYSGFITDEYIKQALQ